MILVAEKLLHFPKQFELAVEPLEEVILRREKYELSEERHMLWARYCSEDCIHVISFNKFKNKRGKINHK